MLSLNILARISDGFKIFRQISNIIILEQDVAGYLYNLNKFLHASLFLGFVQAYIDLEAVAILFQYKYYTIQKSPLY